MDNTVEFKFHIQEIPNRNLVAKFVDKIKTNFVSKGLVEHKDYEIEIESDDLPIIRNEMMVGGATDSTFPYSIIEGLLDYIDNNVRVIKSENIQTDDYEKTAEKKKRIFDGLFTRGETLEGEVQNKDEKPPVLPNTWDKLFVDVRKPEEVKPEEKSTGNLFDIFTPNTKTNIENIKSEEIKNKTIIDMESPDNLIEEPGPNMLVEKVRPIMIEKEYIVKIQVVKDKVKSIGDRYL